MITLSVWRAVVLFLFQEKSRLFQWSQKPQVQGRDRFFLGVCYLSKKVEDEILKMLLPGEEVLLIAEQSRIAPGGSLTTPNRIYVTNRRIIFRNPRLLGLRAEINDFSYEDISNIRLHRGVFSTEIYLKSRFLSDEVVLPAVDKDTASRLNEYIRMGIRKELPGQVISERATAPVVEKPVAIRDPISEVERLFSLKEKGAITVEEFEELKSTLLGTTSRVPQVAQTSAPSAVSHVGTCPSCGAQQSQPARFCSTCGAAFRAPEAEPT